MRRSLTKLLFPIYALAAIAVQAQTVHWQSADTGDPADIELVFENSSPVGTNPPPLPTLPDGASLSFVGPRRESSVSMSSAGVVTHTTVALIYRARSRNGEAFEIPAFAVQTQGGGSAKVEAFKVSSVPQASASLAKSTLTPAASSVWAGEIFPLTYNLDASSNLVQLNATVDWNSAPLVAEEWSRPETNQTFTNGENRYQVVFKTRGYAKTPGKFILEPVHQEISVQTGTIGIGFLQQPRLQQIAVTSSRPEITVKPLPAGAPPGFNGAVGQFTVTGKVQPDTVAVGEPITWTITLNGQGNWPEIPGLPARDVSRTFQVVQPVGKRTLADGKLFDGTFAEDVVLVPSKPGSYQLGPVKFPYFNPKTGEYETAVCDEMTVTVKPDPNAPLTLGAQTAPEQPPAGPVAGSGGTPPPPGPPGVIPRDPLPGQAAAMRPFSPRLITGLALIPIGALAIYWGLLALARARMTDPLRYRRAARNGMLAAINELRTASAPDRRATLLRNWQSNAGILWDIPHAAPSAATLSTPPKTWVQLWAEADRAIYGPESTLPTDWPDRAEAALTDRRIRKFSPFQLFLPRNILPLFAIAAVVGLATVTALKAADAPEVSYRKGSFADAEKGWRTRAAAQTNDWIARHNLALSLLQQDRGPEAAAHITAAFVQHPRDPSVRWHLAPIFEKAAYTPDLMVGFINPAAGHRIAQMASVSEWQLVVVGSSALACLAAAWLLRSAYRGSYGRGGRLVGGTILVLAIGLAGAASFSQRAYGAAVNARAVIAWKAGTLRSIPTEADDAQKTTPLPAGSIAVAGESFLTWQKYTFANGQTGWAHRSDFVPLW